MIEPNFSEGQLQQLVNTEITMRLSSHTGRIFNPIIPSLVEEHELSWDTGFHFPWLLMPPNSRQRGCNIFIQYKLSKLIEGSRGTEYQFWGQPYLKFRIPYSTKNRISGAYFYDYTQYDNLKILANKGYNVFYATNNLVYLEDLLRRAESQNLLNETSFLDVSKIKHRHKNATFTQKSSHFLLHSENEKISKRSWDSVYSGLEKCDDTHISDDLKFLRGFIIKIEEMMDIPGESGLENGFKRIKNSISYSRRISLEVVLISAYLKKYLNLFWYKLWSES